jgi:anthranilate 1,2-dioxygenase small subunit
MRQISNVQSQLLDDASIQATANLVVYQSSEEGVSSLYMVARYAASLVQVQGDLKIKKMSVIVESFGIDTMLAVPL